MTVLGYYITALAPVAGNTHPWLAQQWIICTLCTLLWHFPLAMTTRGKLAHIIRVTVSNTVSKLFK